MHKMAPRHPGMIPALMAFGIVGIAGMLLMARPRQDVDDALSVSHAGATANSTGVISGPRSTPSTSNRSGQSRLAYLDSALTTLSRWQPDEVRPLLATSTANTVDDEQLRQVLAVLQMRLGGLVSYQNPEAVPVTVAGLAGTQRMPPLSSYKFVAHYTEGDALVNLVLEEVPEGFSLYHFEIQTANGNPVAGSGKVIAHGY